MIINLTNNNKKTKTRGERCLRAKNIRASKMKIKA